MYFSGHINSTLLRVGVGFCGGKSRGGRVRAEAEAGEQAKAEALAVEAAQNLATTDLDKNLAENVTYFMVTCEKQLA